MVHQQHQSETATAAAIPAAPPINELDSVFEQFEIVFEKGENPVFIGDQTVVGHLKIKLKHETVLNAIHLQFKGKAKWIGTGKKEDKEGQTEKIYFDKNFVLLERPPGHPGPGHFKFVAHFGYSLPFECPLPNGCETSYESGPAHIRYFARAILETEQREKFIAKKAFTIISTPGLDQLIPPQSEPISRKESVYFGGCCCRKRIDAEIQLPKSAYAPGENIIGSFHIDSRTAPYAVDHIEVRLLDGTERIQPVDQSVAQKNAVKAIENNAAPETTADQNVPETEKQKKQSAKKKKTAKTSAHAKHGKMPEAAAALCQRVVAGSKMDAKVLLMTLTSVAEEKHEKRRRTARVGMENVVFIKVPAVVPTIEGDIDDNNFAQDQQHVQDGQRVLMESPSTATIRARREPFIGVKYALQIALGTHILLEVPITIVYPVSRNADANAISFVPFACGAQPIMEPDEADFRGGPFTFTPQYSVYTESPSQPQPLEAIKETVAELTPAAHQLSPNGTAIVASDGDIGVPTVSSDVRTTITTTIVHKKDTVEAAEEGQHELVPNGAKPYQHDGYQQQQPDQDGGEQRQGEMALINNRDQTEPQMAQQQQKQAPVLTDEMHFTQNGVDDEHIDHELLNGAVHHNHMQERHVVEETYEIVENEDGTKTTIRKSTERNFPENATEGDDLKTDQHQQLLHNQQMDVSMSG